MAPENIILTDTATPLASDAQVDTRDFRILSCTLIGSNGQAMEIGAMVPEIQVRQDMYMGFMSGELMVNDGIDLLAQLQVHGGEYIFLHLQLPEQEIEIKKAFRIYKIGKRTPQENAQKYTVYFMSDELYTSSMNKISKAYPNTSLSDIAKDIIVNTLMVPESKVFIEPSTTPDSLIIPSMRPLEALNWLASRAYTPSHRNTFFFFETFEGFHFRSLQGLFASTHPIKVPFVFENKKAMKNLDMDKFAIDDMEARRDFDSFTTLSEGGYAMRLVSMNLTSHEISTTEYRLDSSITKLYDNPPLSNGGDVFSKSSAHTLTYPSSHGVEEYVKRVMAIAALNSNLIEIVVPGNMGVQAGSLISIRVPYSIVPASGDMWDKQKSGVYLCIATNHKFDQVSHKYTTLAYLCRDSLPESLPPSDTTLPDRIRKLNYST